MSNWMHEYKSKVNRPNYTVLSNQKLCSYFDIDIQNWGTLFGIFLEEIYKVNIYEDNKNDI